MNVNLYILTCHNLPADSYKSSVCGACELEFKLFYSKFLKVLGREPFPDPFTKYGVREKFYIDQVQLLKY